jgi:hypothetical protein
LSASGVALLVVHNANLMKATGEIPVVFLCAVLNLSKCVVFVVYFSWSFFRCRF